MSKSLTPKLGPSGRLSLCGAEKKSSSAASAPISYMPPTIPPPQRHNAVRTTSSYHARVIEGKPSRTAQFVAASRALGALLPDEAQLADDPFGARVAGGAVAGLASLARSLPSLR